MLLRGFSLGMLLLMTLGMSLESTAQSKIQWKTWEEVEQLSKTEPRKVLIDLYTDWCTFCKKMQTGTMCQDNIINYINKNYYAIKFNAETKETIDFNNKSYKYVRSGGTAYNELALTLTQGKLSYPALIFLDEKLEIIQSIHGYMPPEKLEMIITYFSGDHHTKTPWVTYQKNYTPFASYTNGNR